MGIAFLKRFCVLQCSSISETKGLKVHHSKPALRLETMHSMEQTSIMRSILSRNAWNHLELILSTLLF